MQTWEWLKPLPGLTALWHVLPISVKDPGASVGSLLLAKADKETPL